MIMEKTFLEKAKEALVGKYIHFGGLDASDSGILIDITQIGCSCSYNLLVNGKEHFFNYEPLKELCEKGEYGPTNAIDVVSAQSAHTTNDVWQQRWWDVFLAYCSKEGISFKQGAILANEAIKTAMQEMDNFFNTK